MSDNVDWVRADQLGAIFEANGKDYMTCKAQLWNGLKAGRISAMALDATLSDNSTRRGARPKREVDWPVKPEVWDARGRGAHFSLGVGSFSASPAGSYVRVELTGLMFNRAELMEYMGLAENAESRKPDRRGAGGSPVNAEKWANFAGLLAAYAQSGGDIVPGEKAGALFTKALNFGAPLGVLSDDLPSLETCKKALNKAMEIVEAAERPAETD